VRIPARLQASDIVLRQQLRVLRQVGARIKSIPTDPAIPVIRQENILLPLIFEHAGLLEACTIIEFSQVAGQHAGSASLQSTNKHVLLAKIIITRLHNLKLESRVISGREEACLFQAELLSRTGPVLFTCRTEDGQAGCICEGSMLIPSKPIDLAIDDGDLQLRSDSRSWNCASFNRPAPARSLAYSRRFEA